MITTPKSEELVEQIQDWHQTELEIDQSAMLVRNVALTGCQSKNGYRYSPEALQQAVALYDQKPVFLDHPKIGRRPQERSTRDYVGMIINPRYEQERIRGDIKVIKTDSGQTFLALAESQAPGIGMSHVVLAYRNADRTLVEKIEDVISVDAVVYPATTTSLQEQQQEPANVLGSLSSRQAEKSWAELWEQRSGELIKRLEKLEQQLLQQSDMAQLIAESQLPMHALTPVFKEQLQNAGTRQQRLQLLEDRRNLLRSSNTKKPHSESRSLHLEQNEIDSAFIQAVKQV